MSKVISIFGLYLVYLGSIHTMHQPFVGIDGNLIVVGFIVTMIGLAMSKHRASTIQSETDERAKQIVEAVLAGRPTESPFALYLRPFLFDGKILRDRPQDNFFDLDQHLRPGDDPFERLLRDALEAQYELIALGDKSSSIAGVGRAGKYDDWEKVFHKLTERAEAIFIVPYPTKGMLIELKHIIKNSELLKRTVFVMPPVHMANCILDDEVIDDLWRQSRDHLIKNHSLVISQYSSTGALITFNESDKSEEISVPLESMSVPHLRKQIAKLDLHS